MSNKTVLAVLSGLLLVVGVYFAFAPRNAANLRNFSEQSGKKFVAFGDSLTFGQGASSAELSYPRRLEKMLGTEVVNLGLNGETTDSAVRRLPQVLAQKPNYVLITLGGNDLRQGVELRDTLSHLESIFSDIQKGGAAVVYLSINPPLVGDNWSMAIKDVVRQNGVLWVDDIMKDIWGNSALMADPIHPNEKGYEIIATRVHEALKKQIRF